MFAPAGALGKPESPTSLVGGQGSRPLPMPTRPAWSDCGRVEPAQSAGSRAVLLGGVAPLRGLKSCRSHVGVAAVSAREHLVHRRGETRRVAHRLGALA